MFYIKQSHNPEKHPLIPIDFPWQVSDISMGENWIEITPEDFDILHNSFDLTDYDQAIEEENNLRIQNERRVYGTELVDMLTDKVGARNLTLINDGTPVDIATLGGQLNTVATVIRGGAIVTGAGILGMIRPAFPNHADIFDEAIIKINEFVAQQDM